MKKILNLYCGIGGNRKKWGDELSIDAIDNNLNICETYQKLYPNDNVICTDAHQFLLGNFYKYDFIWSSPPCPTHSQMRQNMCVKSGKSNPVYADMTLYQEIIFLTHNFQGKWVVENTRPYYKYLIEPSFYCGRHPFWANFKIKNKKFKRYSILTESNQVSKFSEAYGLDISNFSGFDKRKALRNCVDPNIGAYILKEAFNDCEAKKSRE